MVLNWMHVQVQSDRSDRLDEALAPAAPQGLLVFAGRGGLDVQGDTGKGVDIASVLPRRIMGAGIDSSVTWGNECVICMGEMAAGEDASEASSPAGSSTSLGFSIPWGKEGDECVICLGEMVSGEEVSDLPACNHTFHVECVTKWLYTKAEAGRSCCCPACNALIAFPAFSDHPQPAAEAAPHSSYLCSHRKLFTNTCKLYTSVVIGMFALGIAIYCISQW